MEKLKKFLTNLSAIIGALIVIGGVCYKAFDLDMRSFTSPEIRIGVEKEYIEGPTAEQKQRKILRDSANAVHAMASRKMRDSIAVKQAADLDSMRTLILLNADQVFQIKEEIKNMH